MDSSVPPRTGAVTVTEIDDPTAVGEGMEVLRQDTAQLKSGRLRARRVVVRLGGSVLVYQATNMAMRTRTTVREGRWAFVVCGPEARGTMNGMEMGAGRLVVGRAGEEVELVVAGGYESITLLVAPGELRRHLRGRGRVKEWEMPLRAAVLGSAGAGALYACGRRVVEAAMKRHAAFEVAETGLAAETELVEALLGAIGASVKGSLGRYEATKGEHSRIVRVVEDYVMAHPEERLNVTRLCEAAGVSERTLQYAFKEVMGLTPVGYLNRLRLHRVRKALRGEGRGTTVTREAMRWGFWHFGEFSRAYKGCFGELPSETLRRRR